MLARPRPIRTLALFAVSLASACSGSEGPAISPAPSGLADAEVAPPSGANVDASSEGADAAASPPAVAVDGSAPSSPPGPWTAVGAGVAYKSMGVGASALLVYGGYSAALAHSQGWADALARARGGALAVGHLYAIAGPDTPGYDHLEIANSALVAHLVAAGRAASAPRILVAAHSSGTFVAAELLAMMVAGRASFPPAALGHVSLFNLDGGGGVPETTLAQLARAHFVYACDAVTGACSHNASAMQSLGASYATYGGAMLVHADGSGCQSTWCLHDTLVTTRPHDPGMYDLARDYTDFTGTRAVVTAYLDTLVGAGP